MSSEPRSREARERAAEALVHFALLTGDHARDFVVIGGLNPDFLAPEAPVPHLGTTDVDLLFELGFIYDRDDLDFQWLDTALERGNFRKADEVAGWRWKALLGETQVHLELLCDVPDHPGQPIGLPGATQAAAQNLIGPAEALHNPIERELDVPTAVAQHFPGAPPTVTMRFANLGGYLIAKTAALDSRGLVKDAYDLMFVLLYNGGGPAQAAHSVNDIAVAPHRPSPLPMLDRIIRGYEDPEGELAGLFATQMIIAGDEASEEQLRADAAYGATEFLRALTR